MVSSPGPLLLICLTAACGSDLTLPGSPEPAQLIVVSGGTQKIPGGRWTAEPLVVRVLDTDSRPLGGVPIVYRFADEVPGSAIDPGRVTSTPDGVASTL